MEVSAGWAGPRLRSAIRLALCSGLATAVLLPSILDNVPRSRESGFLVLGAAFAIALIAAAIATIRAERSSRAAWIEAAPAVAVVAVLVVGLLLDWEPLAPWLGDAFVAAFVTFYLLELRGILTANPVAYVALALGGLIVIVSLVMADVEAEADDRQITNAGQAMLWALAQVFRSGALIDIYPVTPPGARLGFIVILAGLLFSAVLFSAVTAWAVRFGRSRDEQSNDRHIRDQVLAALEEAGLVAPAPEHEREAKLFVDVDWLAARRRWGWWTSRERTTAECLGMLEAALAASAESRVVLVVDDRAFHADGTALQGGRVSVKPVPDPAKYIRQSAQIGDAVISGRGSLADTLADKGVVVHAELNLPGRGPGVPPRVGNG